MTNNATKRRVVRQVHETETHIAEVRRAVRAVFEGQKYEMPAPDSTRTLCDKPVTDGIIEDKVDVKDVDCKVCQHINALYYGGDQE